MKRLSVAEVHALKVAELGLDATALDLTSVEALSAALRRIAAFSCPCAPATLVRAAVEPLRGLVNDREALKRLVEDTLDAMIAHGDLLEHGDVDDTPGFSRATLLYAAPPAFIARSSGAVILLGIVSDRLSALPDDLQTRVEHVNHLRRLKPAPGEDLSANLVELGLVQVSYERWLRTPAVVPPDRHISELDELLDSAQPSREVPGLWILDPERPVRYYRGRWINPRSHSGRFVGRRSQAYGADLWCYVELTDGNPHRLVDFPIVPGRWRGCDEAWQLQLAIDANRATPQRFRVRTGPDATRIMEFFSPVPMWARRRWDAIGEPVLGSGCLFAYRLPDAELEEELRYAREVLWLAELSASVHRH